MVKVDYQLPGFKAVKARQAQRSSVLLGQWLYNLRTAKVALGG